MSKYEYNKNVTNYEVAVWLRERPDRELSYSSKNDCYVYHDYIYMSDKADEPAPDSVWVRQGKDGSWTRPTCMYIYEDSEY